MLLLCTLLYLLWLCLYFVHSGASAIYVYSVLFFTVCLGGFFGGPSTLVWSIFCLTSFSLLLSSSSFRRSGFCNQSVHVRDKHFLNMSSRTTVRTPKRLKMIDAITTIHVINEKNKPSERFKNPEHYEWAQW